MHALAREGIEEHRKGGDEGFSLSRRHFRDFSFVQHDTADQLDIVMHHVPGNLVAAGHPMIGIDRLIPVNRNKIRMLHAQVTVKSGRLHDDALILLEPARRTLHNGKRFRKDTCQFSLDRFVLLLDQPVRLGSQFLHLRGGKVSVQFRLDLGDTLLKRLLHRLQPFAERRAAGAQVIIGERVDFPVNRKNLIQRRLDGLVIPVCLGSEYLSENICQCHFYSF